MIIKIKVNLIQAKSAKTLEYVYISYLYCTIIYVGFQCSVHDSNNIDSNITRRFFYGLVILLYLYSAYINITMVVVTII